MQLLTRELETALQTSEKPMVLDFYADWCGPCRMQAPLFQQAEAALLGQAEFRKVDIEQLPELAERFGVMSIPTIVIVQGGQTRWRSVGVTGKEKIVAAVREIIG
jgi:thioredoxin 1